MNARSIKFLAILGVIAGLILSAGCASISTVPTNDGRPGASRGKAPHHEPGRGHGPPPHAPAHGYRHKHASGVDLVYDAELAVYGVAGDVDLYYHRGLFIRYRGDGWQVSVKIGGVWRGAKEGEVPSKLRQSQKARKDNKGGKGKGADRGKGKKKGHDK